MTDTAKVCKHCGQSDFAPGGSCRPCRKAYVERYKAEGANIENPRCAYKPCGKLLSSWQVENGYKHCCSRCANLHLRQAYPIERITA
jgi:hypothetical protein